MTYDGLLPSITSMRGFVDPHLFGRYSGEYSMDASWEAVWATENSHSCNICKLFLRCVLRNLSVCGRYWSQCCVNHVELIQLWNQNMFWEPLSCLDTSNFPFFSSSKTSCVFFPSDFGTKRSFICAEHLKLLCQILGWLRWLTDEL